jgi:hypothetical protein
MCLDVFISCFQAGVDDTHSSRKEVSGSNLHECVQIVLFSSIFPEMSVSLPEYQSLALCRALESFQHFVDPCPPLQLTHRRTSPQQPPLTMDDLLRVLPAWKFRACCAKNIHNAEKKSFLITKGCETILTSPHG